MDTSTAEVRRLAEPDAEGLVNLATLAQAAQRLGGTASGVYTTLDELRETGSVAVLELDNRHFVALVGFEQGQPLVVDAKFLGDIGAEPWSVARLKGHWTGNALIVSKPKK